MFKLELGQTKSVIVLYIATILFSLCAMPAFASDSNAARVKKMLPYM